MSITSARTLAHASRPIGTIRIAKTGAGSFRGGQEERVVFRDTSLVDRLHACAQLSDRQHEAAVWLLCLFNSAGLNPNVSADYAVIREEGDALDDLASSSPARAEDGAPRDRYRRVMREMPAYCVTHVEGVLLDLHPGVRWLATVQAGFDWLADRRGIEKSEGA